MTKKCWRVEVEDEDGTIHLRDGWAAFAKANCLEAGDFLLFECEEQSIFQVKIYDQTGCRKNTFVDPKENKPNPMVIDIEEDGRGESFDCEPQIFSKTRQVRTRNLSMLKDSKVIYKKQHSVSKARWKSSKVGENNTSFSVRLAKKYQFIQQTIPMAVGIEKKLTTKEEVVLQDVKGNCWPVRLGHKKTGHVLLLGGWKQFLDGNNIVIGDTLYFDFISETLAAVQVTKSSKPVANHHREAKFYNKDTDGDRGMPQDNHVTKDQTVDASVTPMKAECNVNCSSFSFPWNKRRARSYLYIPKVIAKELKLKNKENVALRDTDGKYWPLEVRAWHDGRVALTRGWCDFWKGLSLKHGDILKFEFVTPRRIQLSIHRRDVPHEANTEKPTIDMEVADMKGSTNDLIDSIIDMDVIDMKASANGVLDSSVATEVMDIKGFAANLLASTQEHYLLQAPPGFKPIEHHLVRQIN
ncbi:hypothetical protein RND81_06G087800 [Saponaria officinalis]